MSDPVIPPPPVGFENYSVIPQPPAGYENYSPVQSQAITNAIPKGSSADPDPVTRFLNSFGPAVTSPISAAQEMLTPHSNAEKQAQIQHAMDVYSQLQSKDPKIQQSARDQIISALPFGSTYLKARNGDIAGAVGDIGGIGALGAAMGGTGAALDSDLAQSLGSGIKAGAKDVAVGTAKTAAGGGVALGAHSLGGGPFMEYILAKPLIKSGLKQMGQGIKKGVDTGKTTYSLLKDPGDITFPGPSAAEADAFKRPDEGDFQLRSSGTGPQLTKQSDLGLKPNDVEYSGEPFNLTSKDAKNLKFARQQQLDLQPPSLTNAIEKILTPTRESVTLPWEATRDAGVAKTLKTGDKRILPNGSTETLQNVPIDKINYDTTTDPETGKVVHNKVDPIKVKGILENGYSVQPRLNAPNANGDM